MGKAFTDEAVAAQIEALDAEIAEIQAEFDDLSVKYAEGLRCREEEVGPLNQHMRKIGDKIDNLQAKIDKLEEAHGEFLSQKAEVNRRLNFKYGLVRHDVEKSSLEDRLKRAVQKKADALRIAEIIKRPFVEIIILRDYWDATGRRHKAGPLAIPLPIEEASEIIAKGIARFA